MRGFIATALVYMAVKIDKKAVVEIIGNIYKDLKREVEAEEFYERIDRFDASMKEIQNKINRLKSRQAKRKIFN